MVRITDSHRIGGFKLNKCSPRTDDLVGLNDQKKLEKSSSRIINKNNEVDKSNKNRDGPCDHEKREDSIRGLGNTKPSSSGRDVGIPLSEGEQLEKMASDPLAGDGVGNDHEKREESMEGLADNNKVEGKEYFPLMKGVLSPGRIAEESVEVLLSRRVNTLTGAFYFRNSNECSYQISCISRLLKEFEFDDDVSLARISNFNQLL